MGRIRCDIYSGNTLVGEVYIVENNRGPGYYISGLSVKEEMRGKGYGTSLLEMVINKTKGHQVFLEVDANNSYVVDLYRRKGFEIVEKINAKNGRTYLRMQKKAG